MRTDIHSPSNLIPSDYEYVAQECMKIEGLGDVEFIRQHSEYIRAHMARTGGNYSAHEHGGRCMVCGSVNAVYTVLFYHAKTNTYIRTGQECAALIDAKAAAGLDKLRNDVRDAREAQAGKNKAKVVLGDAGLSAAWDVYEGSTGGREENVICDIVGKLVRYGSVSEKQLAFVKNMLDAIANRAAIEAARKAEAELAAPVPAGRVVVTGVVLTVRVDDTQFGRVTKMLVKAESGFKVWGTMPAGACANKGDKIVFKATLKPSDNDHKFGFASRPTLISVEPAPADTVSA